MSDSQSTVLLVTPANFFLNADAALREVIDQLDPADFSAPVPKEWSPLESPTLLGIVGRHAHDEAWIPEVLAGHAAADGDPYTDVDLLGNDPIASCDALNNKAMAAVRAAAIAETFRFADGVHPADEGFAHLATYCTFQAYSIAKHFGIPFRLSPELVAGCNEHVPRTPTNGANGAPPAGIEPPADADDETRLVCVLRFLVPDPRRDDGRLAQTAQSRPHVRDMGGRQRVP